METIEPSDHTPPVFEVVAPLSDPMNTSWGGIIGAWEITTTGGPTASPHGARHRDDDVELAHAHGQWRRTFYRRDGASPVQRYQLGHVTQWDHILLSQSAGIRPKRQ